MESREPTADGADPFELFDRATGAETCRNPYPEFAQALRRGPVQKVDLSAIAGDTAQAALLGEQLPEIYQVLGHEAVSQVLRDGRTFSSAEAYGASMGIVMGPTILAMDEPEHGRYRGLIQTAFSKKALARWEHELVHPVVDGLIDSFSDRGRADLVRELTFPFPVHVIAGMLGLPAGDLPRFHRWAVQLISFGFDPQTGMAASQHLAEYLKPMIAERRERPGDDLISVLAQARLDDHGPGGRLESRPPRSSLSDSAQRAGKSAAWPTSDPSLPQASEGNELDDDHILGFLRLLLPAGAETTYRSSSNLLFGLLSHPEQLEALRGDRSLMDRAIEEGLRWEAPLTGIARRCTRDTEVAGHKIPAGAVVAVNLGAANHDESRYERPEEFDLSRPQRQHMAFAFGPHRCLGMHLARMETEIVVGSVLDRLPNLRLDPEAEDVHITGRGFRAPRSLPVRFG